MSTNDVPGFNPNNRDELHGGCWANHDDGTLLYVQGTEGGKVIFEIFDMSKDPPIEFRDVMPQKQFEKQFSYDAKDPKSVKWTWHDKTPFPWDRILVKFKDGIKPVSADQQIGEAMKVAEARAQRTGKRTRAARKKAKARMVKALSPPALRARNTKGKFAKTVINEGTLKSNLKDPPTTERPSPPRSQRAYTGVVPTEVENAINAQDDIYGDGPPKTVAQKLAAERALKPAELTHADIAHKEEIQIKKGGLADRMRNGIQRAINMLRIGKGE